MLIDMHNHTRISSPCSILAAEELIETARARGLDGICVTEHGHIEGADRAQEAGVRAGFPVFRGVEGRSDLGDALVFGFYEDIADGTPLGELCRMVHARGGFVFLAHPYHTRGGWNLLTAMKEMGLALDEDWERAPELREIDGVETLNGQVGEEDNKKAERLAGRLGVRAIGGSDAHSVGMVARAATRFERPVASDRELVQALGSGLFRPVRRGEGGWR